MPGPNTPREAISVFDIFKIGVGPSSSHTMGPWRAAQKFIAELDLENVDRVEVDLFGSLAKTGKGHGTDIAVLLGLSGHDPVTCDTTQIAHRIDEIKSTKRLELAGKHKIKFEVESDLRFHFSESLPFHPNGIRFTSGEIQRTYYSIGGGFVVDEHDGFNHEVTELPHPIENAAQISEYCRTSNKTIPQIVRENERTWRSDSQIDHDILFIVKTMHVCIFRGCHTEGILPGGLNVIRRAAKLSQRLLPGSEAMSFEEWKDNIKASPCQFQDIVKWVSCFALAVNEENAAFGRVVTAPTNGAAGVIPAVLFYYQLFCQGTQQGVIDFMLTAGEFGSLFKKGATLSAALGGCQAEIGVSSAMAAGGLCQALGGSAEQVMMAAEIAMEHHLGLTCDPIGGLVQIPCIERNTMGAMKAITAANVAMESDPAQAIVSLDKVINTMWKTALDMNMKYKETSEGGLALNIPVNVVEC